MQIYAPLFVCHSLEKQDAVTVPLSLLICPSAPFHTTNLMGIFH